MYTVRRAKTSDREAIVSLWTELIQLHQKLDSRFDPISNSVELYADHLKELLRSHDASIFVATTNLNQQIIGFIVAEIRPHPPFTKPGLYGYILDIFVVEQFRNRGVGAALVKAVQEWFQAKHIVSIQLFVSTSNQLSAAFWQKMGFTDFMSLMSCELASPLA